MAKRLGSDYEKRAADYLFGLGYTIVTRNWTYPGGELDLIAMDGDTLVFVEVRARTTPFSSPEHSISEAKLARLERTAHAYLAETSATEIPFRFDIIAFDSAEMRHHQDVFAG